MTPSPHTIGRDQPLAKAHELMRRFGVRHLPVLDGGVLVGIVSERDLRLLESVADVDVHRTLVEEAMTPEPYIAAPDALLRDVAAEMIEHKYGCAVVMDRAAVVGIFTTVDALRALLALERDVSSSRVVA
jgi:acetoin utilization protein AcuB